MTSLLPTPRMVDLEVTSRCNASCAYCYYRDNKDVGYNDMSTAEWISLIEELGRGHVLSVCLVGGEALVRPGIFEIIDAIVANHLRFQLLSNGSLIDHSVARRLKATSRCDYVQVSLDGPTAEIHDSLRGEGSFDDAVRALRILHDEGVPATVRVTIHSGNVESLPETARFLLEDLELPSFSTNAVSSLGTHDKYDQDIFLTPAQRLRAMRLLTQIEEKYPGRIEANAGPLAEWHMFSDMEHARETGEPLDDRGRLTGCGCVFQRLAVRADGAYVPCVMLPQMVLGHAGVDTLEAVWQDAPALNAMRDRRSIALASFAECSGCDYVELCTGNCPGTSLSLVGEADRPSPEACLKRFKAALESEGSSLWETPA